MINLIINVLHALQLNAHLVLIMYAIVVRQVIIYQEDNVYQVFLAVLRLQENMLIMVFVRIVKIINTISVIAQTLITSVDNVWIAKQLRVNLLMVLGYARIVLYNVKLAQMLVIVRHVLIQV